MNAAAKLTIGSIVEVSIYNTDRAGRKLRFVEIESIEDDIKNGQPGFDGHYVDLASGKPVEGYIAGEPFRVWGYSSQIVRVVK